MGRDKDQRYLRRYTAMFLLCALAYCCMLLINRRVPVYAGDGFNQHFTVLAYISRTVRDLLSGKGFQMVNFSLGQGMDVLTTLTYYGYLDPLNFLSVLFREEQIIYAYVIIDFLRAYLAGLCLIAYARRIGVRSGWALSCAAIILVFDGYALYNLARHTYFLNGMLYLSLLLLGVENVLRERKWLGYVLVTALMLVVNFYFAYMNTVIAILYIIVRLCVRARERRLKGTASDGFALLGGYLLGALLSAVVFLPILIVFLGNARLGERAGYSGSLFHYPLTNYLRMVIGAFTPKGLAGYWTVLSYAPLALFAGLCLLWRRDVRARQVCLALGLCGIALLVPAFGLFMNGAAYVSNRWCYALGLFLALGCALTLPDLLEAGRAAKRWTISGIALVYVAGFLFWWLRDHGHRLLLLPGIALTAVFAVLYGGGWLARLPRAHGRRIIVCFLLATTCVQCFAFYDTAKQKGESRGFEIVDTYRNETVADRLEDDGVYRVGQQYFPDAHAMLKDYMGTSFYWSMVDSRLGDYYRQLGLASQHALDCVLDMGGSSAMNAVAAVKYYTRSPERPHAMAPYGFEPAGTVQAAGGDVFEVFENRYVLPLGYTYDAALPTEEYDDLPVERRLQALLNVAICDTDAVPRGEVPDAAEEIEWSFGQGSGVEIEDKALAFGAGGTLRLDFAAQGDGEIWVIFDGLETTKSGALVVDSDLGETYALRKKQSDNFYFQRPATAICLGGGTETPNGCQLRAQKTVKYTYDSLRVVRLPLEAYRQSVEARRQEALEDITLGRNRLSGRIETTGERVLQIAIPYSQGWSARVDGVPTEIFPCGGMYMGLALNAGIHEIEMTYTTPGLRVGGLVTLAALLVLAALAGIGAWRRRNAD